MVFILGVGLAVANIMVLTTLVSFLAMVFLRQLLANFLAKMCGVCFMSFFAVVFCVCLK